MTAEALTPAQLNAAATITASLRENARRLGLVWRLLPGTVIEAQSPGQVTVLLDGDPAGAPPIPALSLIGALSVGQRVMVMQVPPQGVYVIGSYGRPAAGTKIFRGNYNAAPPNGSINVNVYANYPGSPTVAFTKQWGAAESALLVRYSPYYWTTSATTGVEFAVAIGGTDFKTHQSVGGQVINSWLPSYGEDLITGIPAGATTVVGRWRRGPAGAGTINAGVDGWVSLTVEEVIT